MLRNYVVGTAPVSDVGLTRSRQMVSVLFALLMSSVTWLVRYAWPNKLPR